MTLPGAVEQVCRGGGSAVSDACGGGACAVGWGGQPHTRAAAVAHLQRRHRVHPVRHDGGSDSAAALRGASDDGLDPARAKRPMGSLLPPRPCRRASFGVPRSQRDGPRQRRLGGGKGT
eukprot:4734406-Pyramimonas_sp.AAC.1